MNKGKLNESEKVPGLTQTNAVSKEAKKQNKAAMKDIESKMGKYSKDIKRDDFSAPKAELTKKEELQQDAIEYAGGLQDLEYDLEPGENFKKRAEMYIKGDPKTGNAQGTNDEYANTEAMWGASDNEFGEKLVNATKKRKELKNKSELSLISMGDDIELTNRPPVKKKVAVESTNNKQKTRKMKRLTFKKPFDGQENALSLIPEHLKVDDNVFQLTDGNETYKVRWEGDTAGEAIVVESHNREKMNESVAKMKHLMGYKSENTLGLVKGNARIDENAQFKNIWDRTLGIINEDTETTKDVITESEDVNEMENIDGQSAPVSNDVWDDAQNKGASPHDEYVMEDEVAEGEEVTETEEVTEDAVEETTDVNEAKVGAHAEHVMEDEDVTEGEEVTEAEEVAEAEDITEDAVEESEEVAEGEDVTETEEVTESVKLTEFQIGILEEQFGKITKEKIAQIEATLTEDRKNA